MRCLKCGYSFFSPTSYVPDGCPKCGHLYVSWESFSDKKAGGPKRK